MSKYGTLNRYRDRIQSWFDPFNDSGGSEYGDYAPSLAYEHDKEELYENLELIKRRLRKHIESMNNNNTPPYSLVQASIFGKLNVIDHRLALLESKLECVDAVKDIRVELEELEDIGESSTDLEEWEYFEVSLTL